MRWFVCAFLILAFPKTIATADGPQAPPQIPTNPYQPYAPAPQPYPAAPQAVAPPYAPPQSPLNPPPLPVNPYDHAANAGVSDKHNHLLQAAEHLEAAGLTDDAVRIRQQADRLRDRLLADKLAELEKLKREIQALRQAQQRANQILVKVKAIELSRSKLRELGFDCHLGGNNSASAWQAILGMDGKDEASRETLRLGCDERQGVAALLKALQQENLVKVLAEPSLVTVNGRPATYATGGEIATPRDQRGEVRYRTFGTEVHLLPILQEDGRLKLEIRARVAHLDPSLDVVVDGNAVPGIRAVEVDTGLEMRFGQTAVIAGLTQQRQTRQVDEKTHAESIVQSEVETIFLVTPELVEAMGPVAAESPPTTLPH
ncbi:MAG: hypothetical protein AB7O59_15535 [Pirellulales bacterium]